MRTLLAGALLLSLCVPRFTQSQTPGDSLVLLVSGGTRGRVNGCNCSSGPQGGIERRASLVADILQGRSPFGFDCGAMLDLDPQGGMARSRCMIEGLARQGVKVAGVAGRDLYYGAKFLSDAAASAGVTLVSANLKNSSGGQAFTEWTTVSYDGTLFAVTSLCEPLPRFASPQSLTTEEPDSILKRLEATAPAADYHILLTDLGEASLRQLLNNSDLFDIALTCSRQVYTATPFSVRNALVHHPEPDGRSAEAIVLPRSGKAANARLIRKPIERLTPAHTPTVEWLNDCLSRSASR